MDNFNAGSRTSGQGTNEFSFSEAKMAAIGGRSLPTADDSTTNDGMSFGQAKIEAIGGRSLPNPQEGASTLAPVTDTNVDKFGSFPN